MDEVDPYQLPIPDWDLRCPQCSYALRGLPRHQCPECGLEFDPLEVIKPWSRLRAPHFTGRELPLADFGLQCADCASDLAGSPAHTCQNCGEPFDVAGLVPRREWFPIDQEIASGLPALRVEATLLRHYIPHLTTREATWASVVAGEAYARYGVAIARDFFFDTLWALTQEAKVFRDQVEQSQSGEEWTCRACGESNPANFAVCWSCEKPQQGA
jgi:hypothetical protein